MTIYHFKMWQTAYIAGIRVEVRLHYPPRHLMIESSVPALWEVRYPNGVVRLVRESEIYFIS